MVRSRNWPDLWWQISKIRDIQVVGICDLMKRWRFETNRISSVATAQPQIQKPVFDFDLTWWPELSWPGVEIFTQGVKFNCEQVLKKWRRCAPRFFRYSRKTGGEGIFCPPPVRVLTRALLVLWIFHDLLGGGVWTPPPSISAPAHRRTKRKTAFESSRKIISKSFRSFFGSGQKWGHQGSKFQNFPKRFLDDKIFNFKDRATILIPSCLSRQGASNHV